MEKIYESVTDLVGKTPLVKLKNLTERYKLKANLLAKCEFFNPTFSIKDRAALNMLEKVPFTKINKDTVLVPLMKGSANVALSLNQGVTLETLQVVDNSLRRGVELFRKGRIDKQNQIEQQRTSLQKLNESLDEYQREVVQMIEQEATVIEVYSNTTPTRTSLPHTKRLTPPRGNK